MPKPAPMLGPLTPDPDHPGYVQLQIRLPTPLHKRLRRRAFNEGRSLAEISRIAIAVYLKPKPKEVTP